jgi:kynureninase
MAMMRQDVIELDAKDPLAGFRNEFDLEDGLIYLDGNSLGPLPKSVPARLQTAITEEWGKDLITSWNKNNWFELSQNTGEMIAGIIGGGEGQVVAADGTSINIFKILAAGLKLNSGRNRIVSETGNFPTDLYIAEGLRDLVGPQSCEVVLVDEENIIDAVDDQTAIVLITQVNFRSGRMHDMAAVTRSIQEKGALVCWDLCHSAGAVPVDLDGCNADFAVGCGYKYLNGGPGAPAFLYVAKRHLGKTRQPLSGWHGHKAPFNFDVGYEPAGGIDRFLCGTQPVLSMIALHESMKMWSRVDMLALREKSIALTDLFIELVENKCAGMGFDLASPCDANKRGSQVAFSHEDGYPIMQALIAAKVIGDFRAPDILRFGFTPLYTRYVDVWDAVERLKDIMLSKRYDTPEFRQKSAVT